MERPGGEKLTYDPRRLQGVTVYPDGERAFSEGDRVQFTAPDKALKIADRELGTIDSVDPLSAVCACCRPCFRTPLPLSLSLEGDQPPGCVANRAISGFRSLVYCPETPINWAFGIKQRVLIL